MRSDLSELRTLLAGMAGGDPLRAAPFNALVGRLFKVDKEITLDYLADCLLRAPEALSEAFFALQPDLVVAAAKGLEERARGVLTPAWRVEGVPYCIPASVGLVLGELEGLPFNFGDPKEGIEWSHDEVTVTDLISVEMAHLKWKIIHFLATPAREPPHHTHGFISRFGYQAPGTAVSYAARMLEDLSGWSLEYRTGVYQTRGVCRDFMRQELKGWQAEDREVRVGCTGLRAFTHLPSLAPKSVLNDQGIQAEIGNILACKARSKGTRDSLLKIQFFGGSTIPVVESDLDGVRKALDSKLLSRLKRAGIEVPSYLL